MVFVENIAGEKVATLRLQPDRQDFPQGRGGKLCQRGMVRQRPHDPPAVPAVDGVLRNGREDSLCRRMVFVENIAGEKVATATAYEDITGRDRSGSGWLHWVAVRREYQGRGRGHMAFLSLFSRKYASKSSST
mgnify:CR=1 FL=1